MRKFYCKCGRMLFKGNFADIEIKCGKCERIVKIKAYDQRTWILTPTKEADTIEISK